MGAPFVVANSMREVQPEINILVTPDPQSLVWHATGQEPDWEAQAAEKETTR